MCYDIKASLEAQLNRARRKGDEKAIAEILEKLIPISDVPIYHASGFQHPKLLIYTNRSPDFPEVSIWGLVPHWIKDREHLQKFWNNTLNARGETIFEKPSFRTSARSYRCIIYVSGFYEHHHFNNKTFPFFVYHKNNEPLALAGLYSDWTDKETGEIINTFSIVTTEGNSMMSKIHNNPKLKGPRMPLILPSELEDKWLGPVEDDLDVKELQELIRAFPDDALEAYTVHRLRGKEYLGNTEATSIPFVYEELHLNLSE